jgi:hypothetical protein
MPLLYILPRSGLASVLVDCIAGILENFANPLLGCYCEVGSRAGRGISRSGFVVICILTMLEAVVTIRGICPREPSETGCLDVLQGYQVCYWNWSVIAEATVGTAVMIVMFVLVITSNMMGSFKAGSAGFSAAGLFTFGGMGAATGGAAVIVIVDWAG